MRDDLLHILDSARVSPPTRTALHERLRRPSEPGTVYQPHLLTADGMAILRAVILNLLPDAADLQIAERLETQVATSPGDGWRYDSLPADQEALSQGLRHLDAEAGGSFAAAPAPQQQALLRKAQDGRLTWSGINAARWFEELLAMATAIYVSHPEVMMAIGFDGFADEPTGWSEIGLGNTQPWEPAPGPLVHEKDVQ